MDITLNQGYPDFVGQRLIWAGYTVGPSSYTTGGETLNFPLFKNYIDSINGPVWSVSGNYYAVPIPSAVGPRATWKLVIYSAGGFTQVTSTTNLSAEKFVISGYGGVY